MSAVRAIAGELLDAMVDAIVDRRAGAAISAADQAYWGGAVSVDRDLLRRNAIADLGAAFANTDGAFWELHLEELRRRYLADPVKISDEALAAVGMVRERERG